MATWVCATCGPVPAGAIRHLDHNSPHGHERHECGSSAELDWTTDPKEHDMSAAQKFRKKPVVIEAVQWTGNNESQLRDFAGTQWMYIDPEDRTDDPDKDAAVWDSLHSTWVLMATGDWVIRGIKGEHYPCHPDVFAETYDPAS